VDAIVLGEGWEVLPPHLAQPSPPTGEADKAGAGSTSAATKSWTTLQFQFHLLTAFLPFLLRAPSERSIRVVSLVSPGWAAALPSLQTKPLKASPVTTSGLRGLTTLLVMRHFQLVLDTLASSAYGKETPVPNPDPVAELPGKKREQGVKSNVVGVSVIMPWTREEVVRGAVGADETTVGLLS
jgi:hypothetical protein